MSEKKKEKQASETSFVDFIDKLIVNFSNRFDSFRFGSVSIGMHGEQKGLYRG